MIVFGQCAGRGSDRPAGYGCVTCDPDDSPAGGFARTLREANPTLGCERGTLGRYQCVHTAKSTESQSFHLRRAASGRGVKFECTTRVAYRLESNPGFR